MLKQLLVGVVLTFLLYNEATSQDTATLTITPATLTSTGDSPFCFPDNCTCIAEILRLREQNECSPCMCEEEFPCQRCLCPVTAPCQCVCIDPNAEPPDVEEHDPPQITTEMVSTALDEIAGNMTEITDELKGTNRTILLRCFPNVKSEIRTKTNRVARFVGRVQQATGRAMEMMAAGNNVQNVALLRALDEVIDGLEKGRREHEAMVLFVAHQMAEATGTDIENVDWDDPVQTGRLLELYQPTDDDCIAAKSVIEWWYPPFWYWRWWYHWSIWHRFYYFWFCIYYIRITIRIGVWWWWIWRPWGWPWNWPWGWCPYWWGWGGWWWRPWWWGWWW